MRTDILSHICYGENIPTVKIDKRLSLPRDIFLSDAQRLATLRSLGITQDCVIEDTGDFFQITRGEKFFSPHPSPNTTPNSF